MEDGRFKIQDSRLKMEEDRNVSDKKIMSHE